MLEFRHSVPWTLGVCLLREVTLKSYLIECDTCILSFSSWRENSEQCSAVRELPFQCYITFIGIIRKSPKKALNRLLEVVSKDVRGITGQNMKRISVCLAKRSFEEVGVKAEEENIS